ncbi:ubiquinone biosynthesis protein COQ9 [Sphingomonas sp. BE138]|uniref:COQ9 family protein n=1 Tax=Sphingomonas sp. BE138 TaxID=2817845 RepID=UPI00285DEF60|nr:COQ9 family protein [Sphingomonas sp. BE138]MDR6788997.1 ubiquinone biosynthesis protein COQ9 [Sphingomonas sp. BE138]
MTPDLTPGDVTPDDLTLDEVRARLAPAIAANAAFDGWSDTARDLAAEQEGVDPDVARVAFADGPVAMIDAWFAHVDAAMARALPPEALAAMKIRQRITALVEARLAVLAPDREALRRARAILALPTNVARAAKLGWRSVDAMWRLAGDTATDYNHYTKRAMLLAVYTATTTVFLDDDSEEQADTRAFLGRRIDDIMRFEKTKAQFARRANRRPSLSRFVGRLRYPVV